MPYCTTDFDCSDAVNDLHADPTSVQCAGNPCTADDCCTVEPVADPSFTLRANSCSGLQATELCPAGADNDVRFVGECGFVCTEGTMGEQPYVALAYVNPVFDPSGDTLNGFAPFDSQSGDRELQDYMQVSSSVVGGRGVSIFTIGQPGYPANEQPKPIRIEYVREQGRSVPDPVDYTNDYGFSVSLPLPPPADITINPLNYKLLLNHVSLLDNGLYDATAPVPENSPHLSTKANLPELPDSIWAAVQQDPYPQMVVWFAIPSDSSIPSDDTYLSNLNNATHIWVTVGKDTDDVEHLYLVHAYPSGLDFETSWTRINGLFRLWIDTSDDPEDSSVVTLSERFYTPLDCPGYDFEVNLDLVAEFAQKPFVAGWGPSGHTGGLNPTCNGDSTDGILSTTGVELVNSNGHCVGTFEANQYAIGATGQERTTENLYLAKYMCRVVADTRETTSAGYPVIGKAPYDQTDFNNHHCNDIEADNERIQLFADSTASDTAFVTVDPWWVEDGIDLCSAQVEVNGDSSPP